ncbi:MAG: hypothetical protein AAF806_15875 [Bacteroidota bacterium]
MKKMIFPFLSLLFWLAFFVIGGIFLYLKKVNTITKKAVLAGYAKGGIVDYQLLLYEDSTYYLSTLQLVGYNGQDEWIVDNDTIKLKYENSIAAKIYERKFFEYTNSKFKCISIMELKHFEPLKIVKFPSSR